MVIVGTRGLVTKKWFATHFLASQSEMYFEIVASAFLIHHSALTPTHAVPGDFSNDESLDFKIGNSHNSIF